MRNEELGYAPERLMHSRENITSQYAYSRQKENAVRLRAADITKGISI